MNARQRPLTANRLHIGEGHNRSKGSMLVTSTRYYTAEPPHMERLLVRNPPMLTGDLDRIDHAVCYYRPILSGAAGCLFPLYNNNTLYTYYHQKCKRCMKLKKTSKKTGFKFRLNVKEQIEESMLIRT